MREDFRNLKFQLFFFLVLIASFVIQTTGNFDAGNHSEFGQLMNEFKYLKAQLHSVSKKLQSKCVDKNCRLPSLTFSLPSDPKNIPKQATNRAKAYQVCEQKYLNIKRSPDIVVHPFTNRDIKALNVLMPPFINLDNYLREATNILEIGCGHGRALLQTQAVKESFALCCSVLTRKIAQLYVTLDLTPNST